MNDPVLNNLGRTIGMRFLMIPIIFVGVFVIFAGLGLAMILIASVFGDGEVAGCLMFLTFVGTLFGMLVGGVGLAFYLRKRSFSKFDQSFGWLGKASSYLIKGRQYHGSVRSRNVNLRIFGRARGMGLSIDAIVPIQGGNARMVIGTRSGIGTWVQSMTQSREITGVGFDQSQFALNSIPEHENFARHWISQPENAKRVQALMEHLSSYEIRAIRVEAETVSFHLRHPAGEFFNAETNQAAIEQLVGLAESVEAAQSHQQVESTDVAVSTGPESNSNPLVPGPGPVDEEGSLITDVEICQE